MILSVFSSACSELSAACVNVPAIMKLLIRNLARSTTEEEILTLFKAIGKVQSCNLVLDQKSGLSKGFAFVEIPSPGEAKAAVKSLNGKLVDGNKIRVKYADIKSK